MTQARLATDLWVRAYLKRLELANIAAYVTARGDATSGAVMVKCARLDGQAQLWEHGYDLTAGTRLWRVLYDGPEPDVDAAIRRQRGYDRDLWVIEIENRSGATLLDQDGLAD